MHNGRRIFVVGDLNVAPSAIDRCDAGPDFEKNDFRKWFRSLLVESGGHFFDVFRAIHPQRREAYTCWASNCGAEQFNYGSRIDHILYAGSCLHQEDDLKGHTFISCHVKQCDILTEYKRWKPGDVPRWNGGWNVKLEGSDHVPVYTSLEEITDVAEHSTPSLAARYFPMIHGQQQTLVSLLMKRHTCKQVKSVEASTSFLDESNVVDSCKDSIKRSLDSSNASKINGSFSPLSQDSTDGGSICLVPSRETKKKAKKGQQLSLRSFFQKSSSPSNDIQRSDCGGSIDQTATNVSINQRDLSNAIDHSTEASTADNQSISQERNELSSSVVSQGQEDHNANCSQKSKNDVAILEWQRIQKLMQDSIPLCKGHKEPCVARVVKKPGPTYGHRFYVCARAEGPASNPEANCNFFRWASMKSKKKSSK